MSSIILLVVFNPLLRLVQSPQRPGLAFRILIPNSEELPAFSSTILVLCDEPDSGNPCSSWYKCLVSEYKPDGSALLGEVRLHQVHWQFSRKSAKSYYSLSIPPSTFVPVSHQRSRSLKFSLSSEHKLKPFIDDLTVVSSDHQVALGQLDLCDLIWIFMPTSAIPSCKTIKDYTVTLHSGSTKTLSLRVPRLLVVVWQIRGILLGLLLH